MLELEGRERGLDGMILVVLIKSCLGRDGFGIYGWRDEMMLDDVWNRIGLVMRVGVCLFCLFYWWWFILFICEVSLLFMLGLCRVYYDGLD